MIQKPIRFLSASAFAFCLFISACVSSGSGSPEYLRTSFPAQKSMAKGAYFPPLAAIEPDPASSLKTNAKDWYKDANFYHIWVSAFADSDGDGTGDIKGISMRLDYLKDLGMTALWLSPFLKSNSNQSNLHGYDTTDFLQVDPRLGSNEDARELLLAAHKRGMRVIFDMVPNHVSNKHPWFIDSQAGKPEKRDWFLWTNKIPEKGWKDWGGGTAWRQGGQNAQSQDQAYYAIFWSGMPDLNYRNPDVRKAIADASIYWLNMGFDGVRMDAVRYLFEDPQSGENGVAKVLPETVEYFQRYRAEVLDAYGKLGFDKFMVAENWTGDRDSLREFITKDSREGFQMTMDFGFGGMSYQSINGGAEYFSSEVGLQTYWSEFVAPFLAQTGWLATFLNNHDNYQNRPFTQFKGHQGKIGLAMALQYTGLGTPFWYYGNELDMEGANTGRDTNFRQPTSWENLPSKRRDPASNFQQLKRLTALRAARASLRRGDYRPLESGSESIVAYLRGIEGEESLVLLNLTAAEARAKPSIAGADKARVLLSSNPALIADDKTLDIQAGVELEAFGWAVIALE